MWLAEAITNTAPLMAQGDHWGMVRLIIRSRSAHSVRAWRVLPWMLRALSRWLRTFSRRWRACSVMALMPCSLLPWGSVMVDMVGDRDSVVEGEGGYSG